MVEALEKKNRALYLRGLMMEIIHETFESITQRIGRTRFDALDIVGCIDESAIVDVVDYYYERLLDSYKNHHGFYQNGQKAGRDKVAAFTAIAILTFLPIRPFASIAGDIDVELINEKLALRYAQIVLGVDFERYNNALPSHDVAEQEEKQAILFKNLLQNLRELGETVRARGRAGQPVQSTELIASWVIQSMQLFALAYGVIELAGGEGD